MLATEIRLLTNDELFTYKTIIHRVYDGDMVTANIDLGFHTWLTGEKLRLCRINTPEIRGPERPQGGGLFYAAHSRCLKYPLCPMPFN